MSGMINPVFEGCGLDYDHAESCGQMYLDDVDKAFTGLRGDELRMAKARRLGNNYFFVANAETTTRSAMFLWAVDKPDEAVAPIREHFTVLLQEAFELGWEPQGSYQQWAAPVAVIVNNTELLDKLTDLNTGYTITLPDGEYGTSANTPRGMQLRALRALHHGDNDQAARWIGETRETNLITADPVLQTWIELTTDLADAVRRGDVEAIARIAGLQDSEDVAEITDYFDAAQPVFINWWHTALLTIAARRGLTVPTGLATCPHIFIDPDWSI